MSEMYVILSLIIGNIDVCRATAQENELASYPIGDIGEYIVPKPILGGHNFFSFELAGYWSCCIVESNF